MSKQLFIDIQFLQTDAYGRGMGRYFAALFIEVLKQNPKDSYHCLYSTNLSEDNIIEFQHELEAIPEPSSLHFKPLNLETHSFNNGNYQAVHEHNKLVFTEYLEQHRKSNSQNIWLIPCLMQEPAVPAVPDHPDLIKTVIWYDLIPYLLYDHYFPNHASAYAKSYLKRLNLLPFVDHIYSISEASKNDLIEFMSIPDYKITTINGSINDQLLIDDETELPKTVKQPYFLCPSSPEPSKNVLNTIKGFGKFNAKHNNKYQLVITSNYNEALAAEAHNYSKNVIFTGHVANNELRQLYKNSDGLLFGSSYEGLGLPILEAVNFGKKVVCSNILVFQELGGGEDFYWFEPTLPDSLAEALSLAVKTGAKLSEDQQKKYEAIKQRFTWSNSAKLILDSLNNLKPMAKKTKTVALVGPHPASFSTIGKVIAETFPYLVEQANVHYYYDSGPSDRRHGLVHFHYLQEYQHFYPIDRLANNAEAYNKIIYHMGSSDHHMKTYLVAHSYPDTLILHDTNLAGKGLSAQMLSNGYLSNDRLAIELKIETEFLRQPERFITSLVSSQPKVIAHSDYSAQVIKDYNLSKKENIVKTNLPIHTLKFPEKPVQNTPIKLGIVGILAAVKGTDLIEWLFQETKGLKGCELSVFGFGFFANKSHLNDLSNQFPNLKVAFDLSDLDYKQALSELDVLINYRPVYHGETSRATQEAMRERVVPIVRNIGWFSELPDNVAYKLNDISEVLNIIKRLNTDTDKARKELEPMIDAGQKLLKKRFNFSQYIKELLAD